MSACEHNYPVWGTQGGGLVREVDGTYIFVTKPNCPGLDVGDEMPEMWGIVPANARAREEIDGDFDPREFERDLDEFFDRAFVMVESGEMSFAQVESFFPEEVRTRHAR